MDLSTLGCKKALTWDTAGRQLCMPKHLHFTHHFTYYYCFQSHYYYYIANLGIPLDLKRVARKCRNTEFNPRRYGAVVMKLRDPPGVTCLLFASGKFCLKGCNAIPQASTAAQGVSKIIQKMGYTPRDYLDFKVTGIVASADVGFPIRLEALGYAHSMFASFEPEIFPGLVYRLVHPRVVFMVFCSGKLVMTGAKTEADLSLAFAKLYPILMEYKDSNANNV